MRPVSITAASLWVVVGLMTSSCGGGPEAPLIDDPGFAQQAERICAKEFPPLRADLSDDEPREPGEVAPTIESRAESVEAIVRTLRGLRVDPKARGPVDAWFADWATYVDVGRRYADALKEGDPERYSTVAEEGLEPQARISAFARANGFKSCALDGAPLPPRAGL